jgi:hypothetical protein
VTERLPQSLEAPYLAMQNKNNIAHFPEFSRGLRMIKEFSMHDNVLSTGKCLSTAPVPQWISLELKFCHQYNGHDFFPCRVTVSWVIKYHRKAPIRVLSIE